MRRREALAPLLAMVLLPSGRGASGRRSGAARPRAALSA